MRHSVAYFNPKLNTFHFNIFSLSLCSADVKVFEKKNQIFFCPQKVEKKNTPTSCIRQLEVFFLCNPDCLKQSRTSFLFYSFFYRTISDRISGRISGYMFAFDLQKDYKSWVKIGKVSSLQNDKTLIFLLSNHHGKATEF